MSSNWWHFVIIFKLSPTEYSYYLAANSENWISGDVFAFVGFACLRWEFVLAVERSWLRSFGSIHAQQALCIVAQTPKPHSIYVVFLLCFWFWGQLGIYNIVAFGTQQKNFVKRPGSIILHYHAKDSKGFVVKPLTQLRKYEQSFSIDMRRNLMTWGTQKVCDIWNTRIDNLDATSNMEIYFFTNASLLISYFTKSQEVVVRW